MDYYINRKTNLFTSAIGVSALVSTAAFKARDTVALDVWICDGATPVDLADGATLVFCLKESVAASAPSLAEASAWTKIATGHYRSTLSLNTVALAVAIGDMGSIAALGELTWSEDGGDNWQSSNTLKVTITNDLYKGVEGTPLGLPTPDAWLDARRPAPLYLVAPPMPNGLGYLVSGAITPSAAVGVYAPSGTVHGHPAFAHGVYRLEWNLSFGGRYVIYNSATSEGLWYSSGGESTPGSSSGWTDENSATGMPGLTLAEIPGTAAAAPGQLAIVTTTNGSGTFHDVWTAISTDAWSPPGNIYRDRDTGVLYRVFFKGGAADSELAYP